MRTGCITANITKAKRNTYYIDLVLFDDDRDDAQQAEAKIRAAVNDIWAKVERVRVETVQKKAN